jgi:thiamine-phosphate pyrophosphorylase
MHDVRRILDANANRAREALRVIEDACRFLLDDAGRSATCKTIRHELAEILSAFGELSSHRDTQHDVGTSISTDAEFTRHSARDVVIAACKRLTESLRALEEYGKRLDTDAARRLEQLRYRAYTLEQSVIAALSRRTPHQWRLCLLLTESLCAHHSWRDIVDIALDAGVDMIQLREKSLDDDELIARARYLVDRAHNRAMIIINDRPDIALLADADGVHLGQHDLGVADARRIVGHDRLIGVSTSTMQQARTALADGADYIGLGPVFASSTKKKPDLAGLAYIREWATRDSADGRVPHLAISGITAGNIDEVVRAGARGVAVSSAVCSAPDPKQVIECLLDALTFAPTVASGQ